MCVIITSIMSSSCHATRPVATATKINSAGIRYQVERSHKFTWVQTSSLCPGNERPSQVLSGKLGFAPEGI